MSTTIDMRTSQTQPFILLPTFIDGKGPFDFVLDTGAGISITTEEVARSLVLHNVEAKDALGAGGKGMSVLVGSAASISVGEARVQNAKIGILKALPKCVGQGVIGYDFLRHYVLIIDYGQNTLTLAAPEELRGDDHILSGSMPLRLARPDRPIILVDVLVNAQKTHQFILDTGASQTVVSPVIAAQAGMRCTPYDTIVVAGGVVASTAGRLESLRVGDTVVLDVPVIVSDVFTPLNRAAGSGAEGILGYNVLRNFRVTVDYPDSRLQFQKSPPGHAPGDDGS